MRKNMNKTKSAAVFCGLALGLMPVMAYADDITVNISAYDYAAVESGAAGASENGVILNYDVTVPEGSTAKDAVIKAFSENSISITGVDTSYVTEINGLSAGNYPDLAGWCMDYNHDAFKNWGFDYLGPNADGILANGDQIEFHYTMNGGTDIGMNYYGLPIASEITVGNTKISMDKETTYDAASGTSATVYKVDGEAVNGTGTKEDPFVLSFDEKKDVLSVSVKTAMAKEYVSFNVEDSHDFAEPLSFTMTTRDGLKSYYKLEAANEADTTAEGTSADESAEGTTSTEETTAAEIKPENSSESGDYSMTNYLIVLLVIAVAGLTFTKFKKSK